MRIYFDAGRLDRNIHDWSSGKGTTIRGPKFKHVKLRGVRAPSTAHRFIFYFPSGAWWHFDIMFDRKELPPCR